MPQEISIAFQTDKTYTQYIELAQLVDRYEFDVVSVYCDAPFHPSFSPLMVMAPHIKRARLGVAAISPSRMAPIDMAANIALLAEAASGGVYLGISRGAWLAEHGIHEVTPPIQAVRECISIVKALLAGTFDGYSGQVYQIASHIKPPYKLPEQPVPILVGTWGEKLCAVAGELADEVKIGGSANPDLIAVMKARIAVGERRNGREIGGVGVVMGAVTVIHEDRERARHLARRSAAVYLPVVAPLDPTFEIEPELVSRLQHFVQLRDYESAAAFISDDLLDKCAFSGNAQDIIEQTSALFASGASRVEYGTPHGFPPENGIRLLGEKVLPALRK